METAVTGRTLAWVRDALGRVEGLVRADGLGAVGEREWRGAAIDSRAECSGRLFFAIPGERADGHAFVDAAFAAGAAAIVVEREDTAERLARGGVPYVRVRGSVEALQTLAGAWRGELDARVVAVTGSAGKTTTKEFIRAILRTRHIVHSSPGNYNSMIGVPVTVLESDVDAEYLVCEVGANQPGEIGVLAGLIRPHIGVITNVGDAHVGHFGSRDAIAATKGELLDHLDADGHAVLPRDDDYWDALRSRARCRVTSFGTGGDADVVLENVREDADGVSFAVGGEAFRLHGRGRYSALDACAAIAVGEVCGVDVRSMQEALAAVVPMAGRGRTHRRGGVTVIDESYNASPASMIESLSMLAGVAAAGRRFAVLGDMKELGAYTEDGHERVGRHLARLALDGVVWVGECADAVRRGIEAAGAATPFRGYEDAEAAAAAARFAAGDVVLVKGSHACRLEVFVEHVLEALAGGTE